MTSLPAEGICNKFRFFSWAVVLVGGRRCMSYTMNWRYAWNPNAIHIYFLHTIPDDQKFFLPGVELVVSVLSWSRRHWKFYQYLSPAQVPIQKPLLTK